MLLAASQVDKVMYPGLKSSPCHALAQQLFGGSGGGVLAFEVKGGKAAAQALLQVHLSSQLVLGCPYICLPQRWPCLPIVMPAKPAREGNEKDVMLTRPVHSMSKVCSYRR